MGLDYKSAGVDVNAGYKSVELIKGYVKNTYNKGVIGGLGGFGALFSLKEYKHMEEPVLVSGTDGVGTKLKIAFLADKHDTIGVDCVAMCVNDILCVGAKPLYFLDYIACGKNYPEQIAQIVKGVSDGCVQSECALIGGETAEMPGFYKNGEYDIAGFAVGIVDKKDMIDGSKIKKGDALIGISSSGIHSNGYSLVRKVFRMTKESLNEHIETLDCELKNELLKPTKIYTKVILELISKIDVHGISNITGGGFIENIPRMFATPFEACINEGSWEIPPIFKLIERTGDIKRADMYNTFNMGIGMVVAVSQADAEHALEVLNALGENACIIGEVKKGSGVNIC